MKQKGFAPILITFLVLVVVGSIYYFGTKKGSVLPTPTQFPFSVTTGTPPAFSPVSAWNTYTNSKYNFSFKYPPVWEVKATTENYNFIIGPAEELTTYLTTVDAQKVIYLMMSGPGQKALPKSEWEKGEQYKVEESNNKIDGQNIALRLIAKNGDISYYQKEAEIILPNQQYSAVFDIFSKSLVPIFDQILSTFKFTK